MHARRKACRFVTPQSLTHVRHHFETAEIMWRTPRGYAQHTSWNLSSLAWFVCLVTVVRPAGVNCLLRSSSNNVHFRPSTKHGGSYMLAQSYILHSQITIDGTVLSTETNIQWRTLRRRIRMHPNSAMTFPSSREKIPPAIRSRRQRGISP